MATRIAAFAAIIAALCTPAAAKDIGGHYRMEGTDTTGIAYAGTADIAMTAENICRITFSDGFSGICMVKGATVMLAYIVHGKAGLAVYEISGDGSLQGVFIDDYHGGGIGKETLTPIH